MLWQNHPNSTMAPILVWVQVNEQMIWLLSVHLQVALNRTRFVRNLKKTVDHVSCQCQEVMVLPRAWSPISYRPEKLFFSFTFTLHALLTYTINVLYTLLSLKYVYFFITWSRSVRNSNGKPLVKLKHCNWSK